MYIHIHLYRYIHVYICMHMYRNMYLVIGPQKVFLNIVDAFPKQVRSLCRQLRESVRRRPSFPKSSSLVSLHLSAASILLQYHRMVDCNHRAAQPWMIHR
jgi:hypothetical protein